MAARRLDASALRDWARAAVDGLATHAEEINRLNVFPVADADTGANMLCTMRAAVEQADDRHDDVAQVAAELARGALHGARGNSGVILSQILRALADVTASAEADTEGRLADIDAVRLGAGLRHAVGLVVASMGEAVEGTIVSVLQAAAGAVERSVADGDDLPAAVLAATDAAATALDKTPEQLAVLAEAGVVDAGGRGLLVLLDALAATVTGRVPARPKYVPHPTGSPPGTDTGDQQPPRFEVMYILGGCDAMALESLRERLEALGDSVAIGGNGVEGHSVHVHADDAGAAVEAALAYGTPSHIQITALGTPPARWTDRRAVLAVVDGNGAERLFSGEGACVLRVDSVAAGVSAKGLLQAVIDSGAAHILVLPNGYVAAEELVAGCTAANGWGVDVVPVPTGSMVQGLAALAVHEPGRPAVDDAYAMARAAAATRHASVRRATERALTFAGPCDPGDGLGIAGDEVLVVRRGVGAAARRLLDLLLAGGGELVTVLLGGDVGDAVGADLRTHVSRHHPGIELVTYRTDHRGDALLIGVE